MKTTSEQQEQELRELDRFIAEHVMGWKRETRKKYAAALAVLERCAEHHEAIEICKLVSEDKWSIKSTLTGGFTIQCIHVHGDTLPLAICRFAKAIYSA